MPSGGAAGGASGSVDWSLGCALNIAGSVGKGEAPQMSGISESAMNQSNFAGANTLGVLAQTLPALMGAFGGKQNQATTPTYSDVIRV
jgi:hypothetical protein